MNTMAIIVLQRQLQNFYSMLDEYNDNTSTGKKNIERIEKRIKELEDEIKKFETND